MNPELCLNRMIVDRREEGYIVLIPEDNPDEDIQIPVRFLPDAQEGDIIDLIFQKDEIATREARDRISDHMNRLKNR